MPTTTNLGVSGERTLKMHKFTADVGVKDVQKKLDAIIKAYGRICATCKYWIPGLHYRQTACRGEGFIVPDADYYCINYAMMNDDGQIEDVYNMLEDWSTFEAVQEDAEENRKMIERLKEKSNV
jgi:hypothetical protein